MDAAGSFLTGLVYQLHRVGVFHDRNSVRDRHQYRQVMRDNKLKNQVSFALQGASGEYGVGRPHQARLWVHRE